MRRRKVDDGTTRPARRRFARPPRALLVATLAGLAMVGYLNRHEPVVAQLVQQAGLMQEADQPSGTSEAERPVHRPTPPDRAGPESTGQSTPRWTPPPPQRIGVATFNEFRQLDLAQARSDADRLTALKGLDVIGWQEGSTDGPVYRSLLARGWATKQFARGSRELAVSWRASRFTLVGASQISMARGAGRTHVNYPFGTTFVLRVTLRERSTGRLLTVLDTHLPHKIEDLDDPGHWDRTINAIRGRYQLLRMAVMWANAPGRWVVGTGDYNFDARADRRVQTAGGPIKAFAGHAVSNYQALGFAHVSPTHPPTHRYLDYVHVGRRDIAQKLVSFRGQRTIDGLNSDHHALVVWLTLR